jgi:hypothetical protein
MGSIPGNILVPIAYASWPVVVFILFKKFDHRQAIAAGFIAGWMFLPVASLDIMFLHNTKTVVICLSILVSAYLFEKEKLLAFRFNAADLPMILWCTAPFFSSMVNGDGPYDALSQTLTQTERWGMPYYIARIYFSDAESIKILAFAIFIGAIVYIPFCGFELIMSPQLHRLTYGFHQSDFVQSLREGGGYRPMVYMDHGLMTSMWMVLGVLLGSWLFFNGMLPKKILFIPSHYLLLALVFTTVIMRSAGAVTLLLIALLVLYASTRTKNIVLVIILFLVPSLYIITRSTGYWDGRNLSGLVAEKYSVTRSESLQFRFDNETILVRKALQGSFFGWGGFGRSRVYDDKGRDISVTDGLWVISLGVNGIYGLTMLVLAVQWPALLFLKRIKPELWNSRAWGTSAAMAIFLGIYMIDNLLNAMINPVYMLFGGSLVSMCYNPEPAFSGSYETDSLQPEKEMTMITPGTRFIPSLNARPSRFIG